MPSPTALVLAVSIASSALAQEPDPPPAHPAPPAAAAEAPATGAQEPEAGAAQDEQAAAEKKPPRPGIPVTDTLVHTHCLRCHVLNGELHMTRISYLRKSPEGWAETIKRMVRLHGLVIPPADAKRIVRSLANSHGLARSEAERGLYESERRVHWSEEQQDQDFRRACAECHPLGRVLLQQRDPEEWQLLRATHVAMFPLAQRQMGGGPPREQSRRGPPPEVAAAMAAAQSARGAAGGRGRTRGGAGGDGGEGPQGSVGDRVLQKLAADQPLFTDAWKRWTTNRRTVPLAGTWTVLGHETGRGDLVGTAELTATGDDEYEVRWRLVCSDGSTIDRGGKGLLYAGYSWRGRSQDGDVAWREVLLLDDGWQTLKGRLFTGTHDELGADVTLHRDRGMPRVLGVQNRAIPVPVAGHVLEVVGEAFPQALQPADFFVGEGLTITAVERVDDRRARITVDAAAGAALGTRVVAFGSEPGRAEVVLYDTVDYVRITPLQGLARVGGARHPAQLERFEAIAVNRGADEKPYTDDDVDLFQVRPRWGLEEFRVREDDDDLAYVGSIDATTGLFTPNVDGPNPARKWSGNNVGDVFVTAEVELEVAVRPPEKDAAKPGDEEGGDKEGDTAQEQAGDAAGEPVAAAPARERRTFRARSHLIVTVPLYVKWAALDWEDR